jgi:MurNAc alpha-1-phosphate uridylyltransferase
MIKSAFIFAAGCGTRMMPLTSNTPKPLLKVGGKRLIEWHLEALFDAGIRDVVINTSYLADQFEPVLGRGEQWGLNISYSYEGTEPLETGGGMFHALRLIQGDSFIAVNGDIWTNYDYAQLLEKPERMLHLVMVPNPSQHPKGDFFLDAHGHILNEGEPRLTFSGIGVYRKKMFEFADVCFDLKSNVVNGRPRFPLAPLFRFFIEQGQVTGDIFLGKWSDIGTPDRLAEMDVELAGIVQP